MVKECCGGRTLECRMAGHRHYKEENEETAEMEASIGKKEQGQYRGRWNKER